ncbi:MAG: nucleotidyltransferase family protein [Myxococcota bacterium]
MAGTTSTGRDLSSYVDGWRERARVEQERAAAWRVEVRRRVEEAAQMLAERFGVRRVVLFGSLVRGEAGPGSDVDLLVEGLSSEDFLDAAVVVDRVLSDVTVDLVPRQWARPEVLKRALAEGIVIHG